MDLDINVINLTPEGNIAPVFNLGTENLPVKASSDMGASLNQVLVDLSSEVLERMHSLVVTNSQGTCSVFMAIIFA
jgi:hypothetical protein